MSRKHWYDRASAQVREVRLVRVGPSLGAAWSLARKPWRKSPSPDFASRDLRAQLPVSVSTTTTVHCKRLVHDCSPFLSLIFTSINSSQPRHLWTRPSNPSSRRPKIPPIITHAPMQGSRRRLC